MIKKPASQIAKATHVGKRSADAEATVKKSSKRLRGNSELPVEPTVGRRGNKTTSKQKDEAKSREDLGRYTRKLGESELREG